jgi:hypothetical protein
MLYAYPYSWEMNVFVDEQQIKAHYREIGFTEPEHGYVCSEKDIHQGVKLRDTPSDKIQGKLPIKHTKQYDGEKGQK